jgi:uncharacterized membrane protein YdjX (TVP38/TMEM64 family)
MKEGAGTRAAFWIVLVALLIGFGLTWMFLPVKEWVLSFTGWVRSFGALGMVIFAVAYFFAVVALAPAGLLSVAAGLLFGAWAFPIVVAAATAGAVLAFVIGRYLAREQVKRAVRKRPVLEAIDQAVREEGWKIVVLLRLTPLVPFNIQNYALGVTDVGLLPYALGTFFGIMPGTALYVYLGAIGEAAARGDTGGLLQILFLGVGLITTIVVVVVIGRKAKAKLREVGIKTSPHSNSTVSNSAGTMISRSSQSSE